jgi:hypothetical protein
MTANPAVSPSLEDLEARHVERQAYARAMMLDVSIEERNRIARRWIAEDRGVAIRSLSNG